MSILNWNVAARSAGEQYENYENYMTSVNPSIVQTGSLSDEENEELVSGLNGNANALTGDSFVKTTGNAEETGAVDASSSTVASNNDVHDKALATQSNTLYDKYDEAGSTSEAYTATSLALSESKESNEKLKYMKAGDVDADAQMIRAQAEVENAKNLTVKAADDSQVPNISAQEIANKALTDAKVNKLVSSSRVDATQNEATEADKKYILAKQNEDKIFNAEYVSNPFA